MKNKKTKRQQSKIAKKGKNRTKRTRSKKGGANDGNNFGKKKLAIKHNGTESDESDEEYTRRLQKNPNYQYNNGTEIEENSTPFKSEWMSPAIAVNDPPKPRALGGSGGPILVIGLLGALTAILASQ